MAHAFRIITFLLAGMGCALAAVHIVAPPVDFIPPYLWHLASVLTWAALWLVYLVAAAIAAWRAFMDVRHQPG
jgi:uncharacterized Tic20 family protein